MTSRVVLVPKAIDDLQIIDDEAEPTILEDVQRVGGSRRGLRWLVPLAPWAWFLIRGLHPIMEVVAILLPILLVAVGLVALLLGAYRRDVMFVATFVSLTLMMFVAVVLPGRPTSSAVPPETTRYVAFNLAQQWFTDNDVDFFAHANEPDVFVAVELRETHDQILRERYENAISDVAGFDADPTPPEGITPVEGTYRENDFPSIAIFSDFDIVRLSDPIANAVDGGLPGIRAQVSTEQGDVIVYALHVPPPGRGSEVYQVGASTQAELVDAVAEAVSREELPVVVLGDLNIVDRGPNFANLSGDLTDVMRVDRWAGPTRSRDLWHTLLRLRIDHLLVSDELCGTGAEARSVLFSDHSPIQADVGPCP